MTLFPSSWWQRLTQQFRWRFGRSSEVAFWDRYLKTKGHRWQEEFACRMDPNLELDNELACLVSETQRPYMKVLDVGAGPLTILGKCWNGQRIDLTAVDPLAHEYDKLLAKHQLNPPVRTLKCKGEDVSAQFPANSFDLVHARNCLDHGLDPFKAVSEMVTLVKPGGWVYLKHQPNEGANENWQGLHQWNFSMSEDGCFIISSKHEQVNVTAALKAIARVDCELRNDPGHEWLIVKIQKSGI